jgi:hypothetical protein
MLQVIVAALIAVTPTAFIATEAAIAAQTADGPAGCLIGKNGRPVYTPCRMRNGTIVRR